MVDNEARYPGCGFPEHLKLEKANWLIHEGCEVNQGGVPNGSSRFANDNPSTTNYGVVRIPTPSVATEGYKFQERQIVGS